MKLQTKLIVGFSIILVLVFIVMILFLLSMDDFLNDFNNYKDLSDELNQTSQIETTMLNIQMNVLYYIETSQEKYLKAYKHEKALMDELLYESKKNIVHKERQKIEKIIEKEFSKYDTSFEEITTLILLEDELVNTVLTDIGNRMIFLINSIIKLSEKQNNTKLMLYLSQIQEKIISGRLYVAKYLYENDETRLIVSNYKLKYEMKVLIEKLKPYIASLSKEIKSLWDELLENRLSYISNLTNVVKVHNEANNIINNKLNKSGPDILQEIYNAKSFIRREQNKVGINLNSSSDNTKILVTFVIIITVILTIAIITIITYSVYRTLGEDPSIIAGIMRKMSTGQIKLSTHKEKTVGLLSDMMTLVESLEKKNIFIKEIADGKLDAEIEIISDEDEVGKSLKKMVQSLKEITKTLKQERDNAQRYLDIVEVMILALDEKGNVRMINKNGCKILGYKEEDILGKNWFKHFLPEEIQEKAFTKYNKFIKKEFHYSKNSESVVIDNFGNKLTIRWTYTEILDNNGNRTGILNSGEDITEQLKTKEELKRSEERFKLALEATKDGLLDWDIPSGKVFFSPNYYTMLEYEPDEFEASYQNWYNHIYYDDKEYASGLLQRVISEKLPSFKVEFRTITKSNNIKWVLFRGKTIEYDKNGIPIRILGTHTDITDRKISEEALKKSEEKYRKLIESASDAIFLVKNGVFTECNPKACEMFRCEKDDIIGITPYYISPDTQPDGISSKTKTIEKIYKVLNEENQFFEWTHKRFDGTIFESEVSLTKISYGDESYILAFIRDITQRKKIEKDLKELNENLENLVSERTRELTIANTNLFNTLNELQQTQEQLIQSEKMSALGNLVAGVSHEVNTPLGIGVTGASHLEMKTKEYFTLYQSNKLTRSDMDKFFEILFESLTIILSNLNRAVNMVSSFKQVAVDQTSGNRRLFKLKDYIDEVLLSLRPKLKKTKHKIIINSEGDIEINSYPGAFSQIFTNFIMNSLIHGFENIESGEITIDLFVSNSILTIKYSDNGKGIEKENLSKIYDPFFTTKRAIGGTGLGLNIVYNLVKQTLGGNIFCESELGKGLTFLITVPLHSGRSK